MSAFRKMVSLVRTPEEKKEEAETPPEMSVPDVPWGLRICLTEEELEKLDLDDECEVGDLIHLFAMAEVTSVSKNKSDSGEHCRIELSITHLSVEEESDEEEPE